MSITFTIPAHLHEVPPIRAAVGKLVLKSGHSKKTAFHSAVIVDELLNNAIEHGSKSDSKVQLHIKCEKKQIQITCEDEGGASKVKKEKMIALMSHNKEAKGIRGRGLTKLVRQYAKAIHVHNTKSGGIQITVRVAEKRGKK